MHTSYSYQWKCLAIRTQINLCRTSTVLSAGGKVLVTMIALLGRMQHPICRGRVAESYTDIHERTVHPVEQSGIQLRGGLSSRQAEPAF